MFSCRSIEILLFIALCGTCLATDATACQSTPGAPLSNPDTGVIYVEANLEYTLRCSSNDRPIAWYMNNIPLQNNAETIFGPDGELRFPVIQRNHSGWYTCATNTSLGRMEEDFLLIVGERPMKKDPPNVTTYKVVEGSRVELPCLASNSPLPIPEVVWTDRDGNQVIDDGVKFRVDPTSGSLIINNYSSSDSSVGSSTCQQTNKFGCRVLTVPMNIQLTDPASVPSSVRNGSPLDNKQTPFYIPPNHDRDETLKCLDRSNSYLQNNNLTIQWFKDLEIFNNPNSNPDRIVIRANPVPDPQDSGFYCCSVLFNDIPVTRHCITVWIGVQPTFGPVVPPSFIQLPSYSNRRAQFTCLANTLGYDEPLVEVGINGEFIDRDHGLNFITINNLTSSDSSSLTCNISNFVGKDQLQMQVNVVDVCDGENILLGGNGESHSAWSLDTGASFANINQETVLRLDYSRSSGSFSQLLNTSQALTLHVSGRIRQISADGTSRGTAIIRLSASGSVLCDIQHPNGLSEAWQWVGQPVFLNESSDQIRVELLVLPDTAGQEISGSAFFDNLCVSVTSTIPIQDQQAVIIGAIIGAIVVVLSLLALVLCFVICCLVCPRKKRAGMMKKMSVKMKKGFSQRENRYQSGPAHVSLQAFNSPPPAENPPVLNSIQTETVYETPMTNPVPDNDYINPENYQYMNQLGRVAEAPGYKALDPKTIEDHTYTTTTPVSHRSTASLDIVAQNGTEYMEVGNPYLELLPSSMPKPTTLQDSEEYSRVRSATVPVHLETQTGLYVNAN